MDASPFIVNGGGGIRQFHVVVLSMGLGTTPPQFKLGYIASSTALSNRTCLNDRDVLFCTVQFSSHQPHGPIEHLKYD